MPEDLTLTARTRWLTARTPRLTVSTRQALDALVGSFVEEHAPGASDGEGTVSVWFGSVTGRPSYTRAELEPHYAASTMKLPLLVAAYRRHERGELDLDAEVPVHDDFRSAADGSRYTLEQRDDQDDETWALVGATCSLRRLVLHSVVRSGNLATNLVLDRVGPGEVARVLADAGCSGRTVLPRGIGDAAAREAGSDNVVTAHDLALVISGIASLRLASERTCADIEDVLARQEHRDKIPAGLPRHTYVANKTGWVPGVAHDVAVVRPEGASPYVLAVCTTVAVPEDTASGLVARVSRLVWDGREP